jgi:hypothetical protein
MTEEYTRPSRNEGTKLREAAIDWVTVIDSLITDYQCR